MTSYLANPRHWNAWKTGTILVVSTAVLEAAAFLLPVSGSLIVLAASLAAFASLLRPTTGRQFFSPNRCFLVTFAAYYAVGIFFAKTSSQWTQFTVALTSGTLFAASASIGVHWQRHSVESTSVIDPPKESLQLRTTALLIVFSIGAGAIILLGRQRGGFPLLSSSPDLARLHFFSNGYESELVDTCLRAAAELSGIVFLAKHNKHRWLFAFLSVVSLGLLSLTGNRGLLVGPLLVISVYYLWSRRVSVRALVVLGFVGLLAFSSLGYYRNLRSYGPGYQAQVGQRTLTGNTKYVGPLVVYVAGTSSTFDTTIHTFPSRHPFTLGEQFFGPLLHRKSTDFFLKSTFGLNFKGFGLAVGLLNSFYIDWGFLGIFVGMSVLGVSSGRLHTSASTRGGRWQLGYAFWIANLILSIYSSPFAFLSVILEPTLVLLLVVPILQTSTGDFDVSKVTF